MVAGSSPAGRANLSKRRRARRSRRSGLTLGSAQLDPGSLVQPDLGRHDPVVRRLLDSAPLDVGEALSTHLGDDRLQMRDVLLEEKEDVVAHALALAAWMTVFGRQTESALKADGLQAPDQLAP
jgi:hypothetical protein